MHCASCAGHIEKTLKKTEGVQSVEVNYGTETAKVSFDELKINPHNLSQKIEPLGYSLMIPTTDDMEMSADERRLTILMIKRMFHRGRLTEAARPIFSIMVIR